MNWDQIEGRWAELRGSVRERWGKLTNDDLEVVAGKRDILAAKLQQVYGYAKERAEKEIDKFLADSDRMSVGAGAGAGQQGMGKPRP